MFTFTATIRKYASKGEKTGWTYVAIPDDIIQKLALTDKKGFRIKGYMDDVAFAKLSTYPVGDGEFIIAINSALKRKIGKKEGAMVKIRFDKDISGPLRSKALMAALREDGAALTQFSSLATSHQNYFHRYVEAAKTAPTKAGRIVNTIHAMHRKLDFGQMLRSLKNGGK